MTDREPDEDGRERIASIGPFELRGRRRRPDDPLLVAMEEHREAWRGLGRALLDTGPGRILVRFMDWLERKLSRGKAP
jgi:hypothetical protein